MKKTKSFTSVLGALNFIDDLEKQKIKHHGLHSVLHNAVYHEKFDFLISADVEWAVTYDEPDEPKLEPATVEEKVKDARSKPKSRRPKV